MTRANEVVALCQQGLSPCQIAQTLGLSMFAVKTHLQSKVGEGALRRSDVLFTIPLDTRREFDRVINTNRDSDYFNIIKCAVAAGHEYDTFRLYLDFSKDRVWRGDLYEYIADVEIFVHDLVRRTLEQRYGHDEAGWWRQGVPTPIRTACVDAREKDPSPAKDAYAYTTFMHLGEIIDKNWQCFAALLPPQYAQSKKSFAADLRRLNGIRNGVMHPSKKIELREDDFLFVRSLWRRFCFEAPERAV